MAAAGRARHPPPLLTDLQEFCEPHRVPERVVGGIVVGGDDHRRRAGSRVSFSSFSPSPTRECAHPAGSSARPSPGRGCEWELSGNQARVDLGDRPSLLGGSNALSAYATPRSTWSPISNLARFEPRRRRKWGEDHLGQRARAGRPRRSAQGAARCSPWPPSTPRRITRGAGGSAAADGPPGPPKACAAPAPDRATLDTGEGAPRRGSSAVRRGGSPRRGRGSVEASASALRAARRLLPTSRSAPRDSPLDVPTLTPPHCLGAVKEFATLR